MDPFKRIRRNREAYANTEHQRLNAEIGRLTATINAYAEDINNAVLRMIEDGDWQAYETHRLIATMRQDRHSVISSREKRLAKMDRTSSAMARTALINNG